MINPLKQIKTSTDSTAQNPNNHDEQRKAAKFRNPETKTDKIQI